MTISLKSSFVAEVTTLGSRGVWKKLKQSNISFASASRSVSGGNPNLVSISFRGDVKSNLVCTTVPLREYGDITIAGTRGPKP